MKLLAFTAAALASAFLLFAQGGRSYGPGRVWWSADQGGMLPWLEDYDNPDGMVGISNEGGAVNASGHAFFESLGSNGRACITCHQPSNAMSVSAEAIRQRWQESQGKDALFAAIDGSDCPALPQSKASSHSLLLDRGLFRIYLPWPPKGVEPDFRLEVVRDPTGCNLDPAYGLDSPARSISVFRRPRATANLARLTKGESGEPVGIRLMADGRETSLRSQAIGAIMGHEQAAAHPTTEQLAQIVAFERRISAAQSADIRGGLLTEAEAPTFLGPERASAGLSAFDTWANPSGRAIDGFQKDFRDSVARGSRIFFEGRNACAGCHNDRMVSTPMDIGTTNLASPDAAASLPVFKATCAGDRVVYTQDPGRALITGKCADIGAIAMQQLRGLAARAPYFSNGSAGTLLDVVEFYDKRFGAHYSEREKQDLVNFLRVL